MARSTTKKPPPPSSTSSAERRSSTRSRKPSAKARSPPPAKAPKSLKLKATTKKSAAKKAGKGKELAATVVGAVASLALRRDEENLSRGTSHSAVHTLVKNRAPETLRGKNFMAQVLEVKRDLFEQQVLVYGKAGTSAVTLSQEAWEEIKGFKDEEGPNSEDDEQAAQQYLASAPSPPTSTAKSTSSSSGSSKRKSSRPPKRVAAATSDESEAESGRKTSSTTGKKPRRASSAAAATKSKPQAKARSRSSKRVKVVAPPKGGDEEDGQEEIDQLASSEEEEQAPKPKKGRKKREPKTGPLPRWKKDELIEEVEELRKKVAELEGKEPDAGGEEAGEEGAEHENEVTGKGKGKVVEGPPRPEDGPVPAADHLTLRAKYRRVKDKLRAYEPVPFSDDEDEGEDFPLWPGQQQQQQDGGEDVDLGGMDDFFQDDPFADLPPVGAGQVDGKEQQGVKPAAANGGAEHQQAEETGIEQEKGGEQEKEAEPEKVEEPLFWVDVPPANPSRGQKTTTAASSTPTPTTPAKKPQSFQVEGADGAEVEEKEGGMNGHNGGGGNGFDSPSYPRLDLDGENAQQAQEKTGDLPCSSPFLAGNNGEKGKDRETFRFSSSSPNPHNPSSSSPTKSLDPFAGALASSSRQATTEPSSPVVGGFSSSAVAAFFGPSGDASKVAELATKLEQERATVRGLEQAIGKSEKVIEGYKAEIELLVLRGQHDDDVIATADALNGGAAERLVMLEAALEGATQSLEHEHEARKDAEKKADAMAQKLEKSEADYEALLASGEEGEEARRQTQRENAELKKQLGDKVGEVEQLHDRLVTLQSELKAAQEKPEDAQRDHSSALSAASTTETELREQVELRTKELAAEREIAREAMVQRDLTAERLEQVGKERDEEMREREKVQEELAKEKEHLASEHLKLQTAETTVSTLTAEIADLKGKLEGTDDLRKKAEEDGAQQVGEIARLRAEAEEHQTRLDEATSALDKLEESEAELQKRDQENSDKIDAAKRLVASLLKEKDEAEKAHKAISEQLESLKTAHSSLTSRLEDLATTLEIPLRPLDNGSSTDTLLSVLDELTTRLEKSEEASAIVTKKDEEVKAAKEEMERLRGELKTFAENQSAADEALKEKIARFAQICGVEQVGVEGDVDDSMKEVEALLVAKNKDLEDARKKAQEMEEKVAAEVAERAEKEGTISDLKSSIATLETTVSTLKASVADLEASVSTLEASTADLTQQVSAKEKHLRRISQAVQDSQEGGASPSGGGGEMPVDEA